MTPRQRWLSLLDGRTADRIPTDYQATDEVTSRLLRELDCPDEEALYDRLHVDARRFVEPVFKGDGEPGRRQTDSRQTDMWGIRYRRVDYGTGSYDEPVHHPLATARHVADVRAHPWPEPDDFDYACITEAVGQSDRERGGDVRDDPPLRRVILAIGPMRPAGANYLILTRKTNARKSYNAWATMGTSRLSVNSQTAPR